MTTPTSPESGRRPRWRRRLLLFSGGLLLLLVAAYFVVTSSAFFQSVILPRVSHTLGGQVTVADASISPLSQVSLRQLKVQTTGTEPLLQAEEVRLRYDLIAILRGTLRVHEVTLVSPVIQLVENADGTSNLDPLLQPEAKPAPAPAPASSQPPQVDLRDFTLKNATLRQVKHLPNGGREVVELSGVNVSLDRLQNGQPGKVTLAAALRISRPTNDVLEARSTGNVEFLLGADLMPQTLQARIEQEVSRAQGSLQELAELRTVLAGDVASGNFKELSGRFLRADRLLGEVKLTGPLDLAKKEGRLKLEVPSIDRQVLNLLGAAFGLDFNTTTLNSTTELSLTQAGSVIAANTRFSATRFSVTQQGHTTPPLDLQLACNLTVNIASQSAQVQTLTLDGTQHQKPFLHGSLTQPMTIPWGKTATGAGDSAFDLAVTDFDLAPWTPFLGDAVSAGRLSSQLKLITEQGGRQIKLGATAQVAGLALQLGATPLTQAALQLQLDGQLSQFQKVNLTNYRLVLTRQAQPALSLSGSAHYDGAAFGSQTQTEIIMARFRGSGPTTPLKGAVRLEGVWTNETLDLRQMQLTLAPTPRAPTNGLNLTGFFDLSAPGLTKGRLTAKAETLDLTQLYEAFAAQPSSTTPAATAPSPSAAPANVEPEPVALPLQLTADANLRQVYLREINLQNCEVTAKVDAGKILLDPCRLAVNGAPVQASLNLDVGVKGYTYALSLLMDKVPIEPLANTFSPDKQGQYRGLILAQAQIKGAGVTGTSLQKSLAGQAAFTFTNANIQLMSPTVRKLVVPIATLLRIQAITNSPINWLDAQTDLGGGTIRLRRFAVQSEAFEATTQGAIPIAEVLTNSPLHLPVDFALRRSLAEKSSLLPADTPANARYAMLPQFVTIKGTLGEPASDLNERALAGLLLKSGIGIAEKLGVNVGGKTGDLLKGAGNLLTGEKPASTNQTTTNAAPALNPLDLFRKKK